MNTGDRHMLEQYHKAFGKDYIFPTKDKPSLPLYIAYGVAVKQLKRVKQ